MTIRLPVGQSLTWNQAAIDALGTLSDVKLAKLLGINSHTVQAKRRALGIPPWRQSKKRHQRRCVVCGQTFEVVGGRAQPDAPHMPADAPGDSS